MFQPSIEDLGQPLIDTTFVVVDLETTGGSPDRDRITEIGAVKVRRGEVLGELSTLVDPGRDVPRAITVLTGITNAAVADRPPVAGILPSFLEFARGCTLVAHNARFDVGFLNAALSRLDYPTLEHPVVCTAMLARRVLGDEVRNHRLASLAHHFRSTTVPIHRALADARATVDVLHGLIERAGSFGVTTVEDLIAFSRVSNKPVYVARRKMADGLPHSPGVYRFISPSGEVLYIGKATDLAQRVRQYFGTDRRRRIESLVRESARVDHTVTPTVVEAEVLESREISSLRPRFNRRGVAVRAPVWVRLTQGPFPRLSITRTPGPAQAITLGPLPSRRSAQEVVDAIHDAVPIRRCTTPMKVDTRFAACALADMGRCVAPCIGRSDPDAYVGVSGAAADILLGDLDAAVAVLQERMTARAAAGRYEEAADARDRIHTVVTAIAQARRDEALRAVGLIAATHPVPERPGVRDQHEVLVARHGWLLGTAISSSEDVEQAITDLSARPTPTGVAPPSEVRVIATWLHRTGVRAQHSDSPYVWPVAGGATIAAQTLAITAARRQTHRPEAALAAKRRVRM